MSITNLEIVLSVTGCAGQTYHLAEHALSKALHISIVYNLLHTMYDLCEGCKQGIWYVTVSELVVTCQYNQT